MDDDPSELNDNPKLVNDTLVVIQEDEVSYSYVRKVLYVVRVDQLITAHRIYIINHHILISFKKD